MLLPFSGKPRDGSPPTFRIKHYLSETIFLLFAVVWCSVRFCYREYMENNLKVRIYAEGVLGAFMRKQPMELPAGISIREAAVLAGIPENRPFAVTVNRCAVDLSSCLQPGDEVHLFPQISGGGE